MEKESSNEKTIKEKEIKELLDKVNAQRKLEDLQYAKEAVKSCLENHAVLVDMHGLEYWAGRVEKLRNEILEVL